MIPIPEMHDQVINFLLWIISIFTALILAGMWMMYLMKLVINEDETAEKIRRYYRVAEELTRSEN